MALGVQTSSSALATSDARFAPVTVYGGGGGGLLPKLPGNQAWVAYAVAGVVALLVLVWWFKRK